MKLHPSALTDLAPASLAPAAPDVVPALEPDVVVPVVEPDVVVPVAEPDVVPVAEPDVAVPVEEPAVVPPVAEPEVVGFPLTAPEVVAPVTEPDVEAPEADPDVGFVPEVAPIPASAPEAGLPLAPDPLLELGGDVTASPPQAANARAATVSTPRLPARHVLHSIRRTDF